MTLLPASVVSYTIFIIYIDTLIYIGWLYLPYSILTELQPEFAEFTQFVVMHANYNFSIVPKYLNFDTISDDTLAVLCYFLLYSTLHT